MSKWQRRVDIMLCYPFEEKRLAKWPTPYVMQPKMDGDRCRAVYWNGTWVLLSSEGNAITMLPHINGALLELPPGEYDGELYLHGVPHELIHGVVSRSVNPHQFAETIEYHIFDIINDQPQLSRAAMLAGIARQIRPSSPIKIVPTTVRNTLDQVIRYLDTQMEAGYEGMIIRHPSALYIRRRSTGIMKFKPGREDEYIIIGAVEELDQYKVPKNALGALICTAEDARETFRLGTGFTEKQRKELWENFLDTGYPVGRRVRVKYQHLTHTNGVPRNPVFKELV